MAYILGYWYADGCINHINNAHRFRITSKDKEQLFKFKNIISNYGKNSVFKRTYIYDLDKKNRIPYLAINSKDIYNDIINIGGTERKSLKCKFPDIPEKYIRDFIRGYFDGDGSIWFTKSGIPCIEFLGNIEFLREIEKNLPYKGLYQKKGENGLFRLWYYGNYSKVVLRYMYAHSKVYLQRKHDRYVKAIKWDYMRKPQKNNQLDIINNLREGVI
jgi:hypothetical protein